MTKHTPSRSAPASIATRVPDAPDATIEAQASRMSLRIAEIAARHSKLSSLANDLTSYLREELRADAAVLYWRRSKERAGRGKSAILQPVGIACGSSSPDTADSADHADRCARRLKASGYRALSGGKLFMRSSISAGTSAGDETARAKRSTVAVPVGTHAPWAVLVATWDAISSATFTEYASTLDVLRSMLAVATRPAHVLDEAAHADHAQSPRRTVFAVTSEAIITLDEDFTIREINPAFTAILGWPEHAAAGRRCSDLLRCRDDRRMLLCGTPRCPLHEAFETSGATPVRDLRWETQSGKASEVSASFTVQRSEHHARAVIVARDVTLLNSANRMRANFISMVSHELRTPLNSINGFLEIVLESPVGPLNERQREFLNYARVSTQQLATLVEDILFISKADSGQFTLRLARVRVPKVVDSALQAVQSLAEKAQVPLVAELPSGLPTLRADELRIQQVLTNLLGNAIKFSPAESTVRLHVSVGDAALQFAVSDQGKGITPEDHARIFERFYQSDSNVRNRAGGYGLGLSIAKLIVEQHHGRIWVESEPGEGATFYFTLPLIAS